MSGQAMCRGNGVGVLAAVLLVGVVALQPAPARAQDMKPETEEHCKAATILVFTAESHSDKGDTPLGSGSGFFINSTGLCITNNHVVDPTHMQPAPIKERWHYTHGRLTWLVITQSGTEDEKRWEADLLYQNETADQAVLQVKDEDGEKLETPDYLRILPETRYKKWLKLYAFGFPGGDSLKSTGEDHPEVSKSDGHIREFPRTPAGRIRLIYSDVLARPGNSGGPCVDSDGFLVGTVTILAKPEGRQDTGGQRHTGLVPSSLTKEMVRNAFILDIIPGGSDVTPFVDVLVDDKGRTNIPEFRRRADKDVLVYEDGDRIYGEIATEKITWDSPLGTVEVPTNAIAYMINSEEGAQLYLEGGNRLEATEAGSSFEFKAAGGVQGEQAFDDVHVVAFKTKDRKLDPIAGLTVILDSGRGRLVLTDVKGEAAFQSKVGTIKVKLEEIARIEAREDDGLQVLITADGRRFSGSFNESPLDAVIAATGTPIRFRLNDIGFGVVESVFYDPNKEGGLSLLDLLTDVDSGKEIIGIARTLVSDDPSGAQSKLDDLLVASTFKNLPEQRQEEIRLLQGVFALRNGDAKGADSAFRKARQSEHLNIASYCNACTELLKRFPGMKFNGKSISDRATFVAAGKALAGELIEKVRTVLKNAQDLKGEREAEYKTGIGTVRKYENLMRVAAIFAGEVGDDEMIRLWVHATDLCQRELERLDREVQEERDKAQERSERGGARERRGSRGGRGGRGAESTLDRLVRENEEKKEEVQEVYRDYYVKLMKYGFRVQDPDIQKRREKRAAEEGTDGP